MTHFNNSVINVVGTYYTGVYVKPELMNKIVIGQRVDLIREPGNKHDSNAVKVYLHGVDHRYGYIPRRLAARLAPILDRGSRYECFVKGKRGRRNPQIIISLTTYPVSRPNQADDPRAPNNLILSRPRLPNPPDTPTGKAFRRIVNFDEHCRKYNGVSGIYIIWNRRNKSYIGQSRNVGYRWRTHERNLSIRCHENKDLQEDWVQMGASEFRFDLLEEVEPDRLDEREEFHINRLRTYFQGYNQTPDGQANPNKTFSPSDKTIIDDNQPDKPVLAAQSEDKLTSDQAPPLQGLYLIDVPDRTPNEKEPKIPQPFFPTRPTRDDPDRKKTYDPNGTIFCLHPPIDKSTSKKSNTPTADMLEKYCGAFVATILIIPFILLICFYFQSNTPPATGEASYSNYSEGRSGKRALQGKEELVVWHEVKEGESLCSIANKYQTTVESIATDNDIENKDIIYRGEILKITLPQ